MLVYGEVVDYIGAKFLSHLLVSHQSVRPGGGHETYGALGDAGGLKIAGDDRQYLRQRCISRIVLNKEQNIFFALCERSE